MPNLGEIQCVFQHNIFKVINTYTYPLAGMGSVQTQDEKFG